MNVTNENGSIPFTLHQTRIQALLRSPFYVIRGLNDSIENAEELVETISSDVRINELLVPTFGEQNIPISSYATDFLRHGQFKTLLRENGLDDHTVHRNLTEFEFGIKATAVALFKSINEKVKQINNQLVVDGVHYI
jgi:hypothetical protein